MPGTCMCIHGNGVAWQSTFGDIKILEKIGDSACRYSYTNVAYKWLFKKTYVLKYHQIVTLESNKLRQVLKNWQNA